jgi:YD repeat-containing protein
MPALCQRVTHPLVRTLFVPFVRRCRSSQQSSRLYRYDDAGRLSSIDNAAATSSTEPNFFITSQSYNTRGQTTAIAYGDGSSTAFTYNDQRGWLTRVLSQNGATVHLDQSYVRDAKGLITRITSPQVGNSIAYTYDGLDRLITSDSDTNADDRSFAYDDADNMIYNSGLCAGSAASPNLVYPAQGVTSGRPYGPSRICGTPVTYDTNGNTLTYDVDGAGIDQPRTLIYDNENRPLVVQRGGVTSIMAYGPDGERTAKINGTAATHYLGNDAEVSPTGVVTTYLHPDNGSTYPADGKSIMFRLIFDYSQVYFKRTPKEAKRLSVFGFYFGYKNENDSDNCSES